MRVLRHPDRVRENRVRPPRSTQRHGAVLHNLRRDGGEGGMTGERESLCESRDPSLWKLGLRLLWARRRGLPVRVQVNTGQGWLYVWGRGRPARHGDWRRKPRPDGGQIHG